MEKSKQQFALWTPEMCEKDGISQVCCHHVSHGDSDSRKPFTSKVSFKWWSMRWGEWVQPQGGRARSSHEEHFLTRSEPWGEGMVDMRDSGLPS